MRFSPVRRVMVVGAVLAAFAIAGSVALAAIPTTGGTVYSCYNKTTGVMRAINYPTKRCTSAERMVALASATTTPKTVTGSFLATYTGSEFDLVPNLIRFEVRTDASGAVTFGYYQSQPVGHPEFATAGVVESVRFFRNASGAKAAELRMTECNVGSPAGAFDPMCNDHAAVVVSDGTPDTFCGLDADTCRWPFSVDAGNIAINMGGQNDQ